MDQKLYLDYGGKKLVIEPAPPQPCAFGSCLADRIVKYAISEWGPVACCENHMMQAAAAVVRTTFDDNTGEHVNVNGEVLKSPVKPITTPIFVFEILANKETKDS